MTQLTVVQLVLVLTLNIYPVRFHRDYLKYAALFPHYRMRFTWAKGSGIALGVGLATSGTPKTFQNLSVSSPAADATVQPSGLWKK
jgi:hypothetical protein